MENYNQFECPNCPTIFNLVELLESCTVSWPNQKWILFECPRCSDSYHVELGKALVSIGSLDGAPGPAFIPISSSKVEFEIKISSTGISVFTDNQKFHFKAAR